MRRALIRPAAVLASLALLAGGCARARISHPSGARDLVLRVSTGGGFVGPGAVFAQIPEISLFGDGSLVTPGPQMEMYPGPALPNLLVARLSEEGVQRVLRAARAAGLLGSDRTLLHSGVADAPTTTFTVVAGGRRHVVSAYALGIDDSGSMIPAGARAARARLGDLRSWLATGAIGEERPYEPRALRILVEPPSASPEPGIVRQTKSWPLATPLATFGRPAGPDRRCGVAEGTDLAVLLPQVREANQLTIWRSAGRAYHLSFRPLLPDESGC
ncbi:MAG: hypothetical protein HY775_05775 [Acidobacteria bacterium]|nr:hypothetical protein [Acidobacteriota bacterium]